MKNSLFVKFTQQFVGGENSIFTWQTSLKGHIEGKHKNKTVYKIDFSCYREGNNFNKSKELVLKELETQKIGFTIKFYSNSPVVKLTGKIHNIVIEAGDSNMELIATKFEKIDFISQLLGNHYFFDV